MTIWVFSVQMPRWWSERRISWQLKFPWLVVVQKWIFRFQKKTFHQKIFSYICGHRGHSVPHQKIFCRTSMVIRAIPSSKRILTYVYGHKGHSLIKKYFIVRLRSWGTFICTSLDSIPIKTRHMWYFVLNPTCFYVRDSGFGFQRDGLFNAEIISTYFALCVPLLHFVCHFTALCV